jgi:tetratricopeptide (TPR) repeat protein
MNHKDADSTNEVGYPNLDFAGVDFDPPEIDTSLVEAERFALDLELDTVGKQWKDDDSSNPNRRPIPEEAITLAAVSSQLAEGKYLDILRGDFASKLLGVSAEHVELSFWSLVRKRLSLNCSSVLDCVQAEMVGIAAFNLFQQLNYTGPTLDIQALAADVNPHPCFREKMQAIDYDEANAKSITAKRHTQYHNCVLAELACDGQWPCQVVEAPYFLLLARCIFLTLSDSARTDWTGGCSGDPFPMDDSFMSMVSHLSAASIWSARASAAHERLLLTQEPTPTLWKEIESIYPRCLRMMEDKTRYLRAMVYLEYGLACHHFRRPKQAKSFFLKAKEISRLFLEVTGADGKRTKFQQKATAQLVVRAVSLKDDAEHNSSPLASGMDSDKQESIISQMIGFNEDTILHERVKFENEEENKILPLTILDQAILLGLCLDIKDNNPADKLTAEEMSAYLSRVLCHHDDWMVYSTALLERAWLEFEGNHTKERSILQMQALADQHTDRLTITQSTRKSIDDSSPVQDRLKNLHSIVYPPRWQMLGDVAERYASIGIVTSAAEIYTEIEAWDEVVDCYRRAGRVKKAEEIVRERLAINETPRMWTALGDITNEPEHYEKAIELSRGRFSQAYLSLGKYFFDKGDLQQAAHNYRQALKLRPLIPSVWFRVGTICMRLKDWEGALTAFTEVVLQHPEEAEAWANVAAIHIHNKKPAEAYPALNESIKYNRSNWRVWVSKLYTCLDLSKFDEATQACNALLDLKSQKSSKQVPDLEEKCVRAIVGGTVENYLAAKANSDDAALDASRRSLVRTQELLDRLGATMNDPWVYEVRAFLYSRVGRDKEVFENLMKEYRSLTSLRSWEKDDQQVLRVCRTVTQIVNYQRDNREEITKSRFLLSGIIKKMKQSRSHGGSLPQEVTALDQLLDELNAKLEEQT